MNNVRLVIINGAQYQLSGPASVQLIMAAMRLANLRTAPLIDVDGDTDYEVVYHPPGKIWGSDGYLGTRERRDWPGVV